VRYRFRSEGTAKVRRKARTSEAYGFFPGPYLGFLLYVRYIDRGTTCLNRQSGVRLIIIIIINLISKSSLFTGLTHLKVFLKSSYRVI
jgi:hypothetical protein